MTHQPEQQDNVGIVTPQTLHFDQPLALSCGRSLPEHDIVFETYGELNAARSNAILICHALSGHHHAAGRHHPDERKPGWWDSCIGPGKPIDTNVFFVLSINNIGGCHGSTGPTSTNPETGKPWGPDFPPLRCRDWVESQRLMMAHFGIEQWAAIIGGSLGGMQAMRWALEYPDAMRHCVVIASAMKLSAQNIAFNEIARNAICSDPNFHQGRYLEHDTLPRQGLALARMIGHVTYLSDDGMKEKFGRDLKAGDLKLGSQGPVEFQVESYLRHQGSRFAESFGRTVLEAMAAGRPVVCYDRGTPPELVGRDGRAGIVVPADDAAAVAAAIADIAGDPARLEAMSQAARARAQTLRTQPEDTSYCGVFTPRITLPNV